MNKSVVSLIGDRIHRLTVLTPVLAWLLPSVITAFLTLSLFRSSIFDRLGLSFSSRRQDEGQEPGLFVKYSTYQSFSTPSGHTYPKIRVFYHAHSQASKLPNDLPLLVFMHGLGGNATQFSPLLTSLINIAPCLAIDLPGCGLSEFKPDMVTAYSTTAFAELLYCAIKAHQDVENGQKVILIGHSMGASICALLAASTSPLAHLLSGSIIGNVAICPKSTIPSQKEVLAIERLRWMPSSIFDMLRMVDRRGGLESHSISRVVGEGADTETKKLQHRYNAQSKSPVFLRFITGMLLPRSDVTKIRSTSWPGETVWSSIKVPLFLVAGESDKLTPPSEVEQITRWLIKTDPTTTAPASEVVTSEPQERQHSTKHALVLKTTVFPAPAAHGLMYATSTVRILAGLIENFLAHHVDERLSPGWQLQHLTTNGKWDVKNLKKWQSIDPCSEPIGGVFRAMKTMREVDEVHCPKEFAKHFSSSVLPDGVAMVIDISHDSPVYDPAGLEAAGVEYHKFPTVSKLPPTSDEVEHFIALIDDIRKRDQLQPKVGGKTHPTIGIHCHYGFNRTGVFVTSYLIERLGYSLHDAIGEFAAKRPPGIKHEHFINELFVRYAVQLPRRGTVVA